MSLERKLLSALVAITTFAASLNAALTATRYEVVNIGALTFMPYSARVSVNNSGLVTGYRNTVNSQTAYVWGGSYTDLGYPSPATSSQGYDVNDLGQVAGHLNGGQAFGAFASAPAAFLWSPVVGFTTIITSH